MTQHFSRRQILAFFGGSAVTTALSPLVGGAIGNAVFGSDAAIAAETPLGFTPVRMPHALPIYQFTPSYLPTGSQQGTVLPQVRSAEQMHLNQYNVVDDLVVPPEYERYIITRWGDRVFPNGDEYVGYNCDYTGYIPVTGNRDGYLWINHEYVGYPISRLAPETPADITAAFPEAGPAVISGFPTTMSRALVGEFLYNMGGSIVRIQKKISDRFTVVRDNGNRRIHGLSGLGINATRKDIYRTVTSWGTKSYQVGDQNYLIGTGPAATQVFNLPLLR